MTEANTLILDIHSPELTEPLTEFRETVREMFAGREEAICRQYPAMSGGMPLFHAESPAGGTWQPPFRLHGARVTAAIIDEGVDLTQARGDLVSVEAFLENIQGPGRNEGEIRRRDFQLRFSRQDEVGSIALSRIHTQTFQSEHSTALGSANSNSKRQGREPLTDVAEIHQYLRGAAHLIRVFLDPDEYPKSKLLR